MSRFTSTAFGLAALVVAGSSAAETRSYDLTGFDRIDISSGIVASVEVGPEYAIQVQIEDSSAFDHLGVDIDGRTLEIKYKPGLLNSLVERRARINVTITLPELRRIEASVGAAITLTGAFGPEIKAEASVGASINIDGLAARRVDLDSSGGARITANGTCEILHVDSSSGAAIRATGLTCDDVWADVSSGGLARVWAAESIDADASTGGQVVVAGHPALIDVDENTGGDIDFE